MTKKNLLMSFLMIQTLSFSLELENIFEASSIGSTKEIASFLKKGVPIDAQDEDGTTALASAVLASKYVNIQYLLNKGANVTIADSDGDTPLMSLCIMGLTHDSHLMDIKIAKLFLAKGALLKRTNKEGISTQSLCQQFSPAIIAGIN